MNNELQDESIQKQMRMLRRVKNCYRNYRAGFKFANRTYVWRRGLQQSSGRGMEGGMIKRLCEMRKEKLKDRSKMKWQKY